MSLKCKQKYHQLFVLKQMVAKNKSIMHNMNFQRVSFQFKNGRNNKKHRLTHILLHC